MKNFSIFLLLRVLLFVFIIMLTVSCSSSKLSSNIILKNQEVLAKGENENKYKWTSFIKCDGAAGSYKSCNINGKGNICSPGGSVTCICGENCE